VLVAARLVATGSWQQALTVPVVGQRYFLARPNALTSRSLLSCCAEGKGIAEVSPLF